MENNNSISSSSENKPQITSSEGKQATTSGVQTQVKQAQEEALENLRAVIGGVNNQLEKEGYNISHDEAYAEDSNGPLLAYISQSIRSNIDIGMWYKYEKKEKKEYEQARKRKAPPFRPQQTVTAAALADYGSEYRFIIGVNFHDKYGTSNQATSW
jgi:hypothetical protein